MTKQQTQQKAKEWLSDNNIPIQIGYVKTWDLIQITTDFALSLQPELPSDEDIEKEKWDRYLKEDEDYIYDFDDQKEWEAFVDGANWLKSKLNQSE